MARKDLPEAMPPPQEPPELGLSDVLLEAADEPSEMDKIIAMFLDPKNIHHLTELNRNEVTAFSVLAALAKKYQLEFLKDFLAYNLIMRVSHKRGGRKEFAKIVSRLPQMQDDGMIQQPGGWRRFMRRR